jgi:ubiquinone/menaquinone biosynthesis C-methylase UbiE
VKHYYDRRASEYDEWYEGTGRFAPDARPGWAQDVSALCAAIAELPPARTLDVACGTGYLTRWLAGDIVGFDQSESMLEIASKRVPSARFVAGDALSLPFADGEFERVFTGHFYGHLEDAARTQFLAEARRVAQELVVVDAALRDDRASASWQERILNDGSRHEVFKRYFDDAELADELGGGEVLYAGRWFVMVRTSRPTTVFAT